MNQKNREKVRQNTIEDLAFKKQVDDYFNGTLNRKETVFVGTTPNALTIIGFNPDLDVIIKPKDLDKCTKSSWQIYHGHSLNKSIIEQIPEQLRNPVLMIRNPENSNIVAVTDLKDKYGDRIIIAVRQNFTEKRHISNRIASCYGKKDFKGYLKNQLNEGNIIAINKTKADKLFQSVGLQLPSEETLISYNNSIAFSTENVKYPKQKNMKNISKSVNKIQQSLNVQNKEPTVTPLNKYTAEAVHDMKYISIYKYLSDKSSQGASENNLGCSYIQGISVKRDFSKAVKLFEASRAKGSDVAVLNLAVCYSFGLGVNRDLSKAYSFWKKAAGIGNAVGLKQLGDCYYHGRGVKQDSMEALKYYKEAEKAGDEDSVKMVRKLTYKKPVQNRSPSKTDGKDRPALTSKQQSHQQTAKNTNKNKNFHLR